MLATDRDSNNDSNNDSDNENNDSDNDSDTLFCDAMGTEQTIALVQTTVKPANDLGFISQNIKVIRRHSPF
jgi:hypothetical protein